MEVYAFGVKSYQRDKYLEVEEEKKVRWENWERCGYLRREGFPWFHNWKGSSYLEKKSPMIKLIL